MGQEKNLSSLDKCARSQEVKHEYYQKHYGEEYVFICWKVLK